MSYPYLEAIGYLGGATISKEHLEDQLKEIQDTKLINVSDIDPAYESILGGYDVELMDTSQDVIVTNINGVYYAVGDASAVGILQAYNNQHLEDAKVKVVEVGSESFTLGNKSLGLERWEDEAEEESYLSVMESEVNNLKIDARLLRNIHNYKQQFINKNQDHVQFFANPFAGVYPVRFTTSDKNQWFDDIIDADDYVIAQRLKNVKGVDREWVRATDPFNISCLYLVYKLINSNLSNRQKRDAIVDVITVLHFKLITSLDAYYFKYSVDPATAQAVYNSLSNKYSLKKYGSWLKVIESRAEDLMSPKSIHRKALDTFHTTEAVIYAISDIQVRMREIYKGQYEVLTQVRKSDAAIITKGNTVTIEGDTIMRDLQRDEYKYRNYIERVAMDARQFIKEDLVVVITHAIHTMPIEPFERALKHIPKVYGTPRGKDIERLVELVFLHAVSHISGDTTMSYNKVDLPTIVNSLRRAYTVSRTKDELVLEMRELGTKIFKPIVRSRNDTVVSAVRTGVCLYIALRIFAMNYYK